MKNKLMVSALAAFLIAGCSSQANEQNKINIAQLEQEPQIEVAAKGNIAPDFTLKGSEGAPISLSDLRGKYVVLDFWGTWCRWCVKGIPDMKAYYEKYKGMYEMLSIDFGDNEETWLKAIDEYGMTWKHVITDKESAQALQKVYAIEGFPTKMIVDPEGKIINITVGESPDFYKFLDDLFGKK